MIEVTENDDKTFTISWDENDPEESIFNDFTEQDFINLIQNYLQSLEESGEVDNTKEEFFIDQSAEEVNQDINTLHDWYSVKEEAIDEYLKETNIETYGDQGTEQSQGGTVPPPPNFPLFP